jgi:type IV pilus assembly protein PilE
LGAETIGYTKPPQVLQKAVDTQLAQRRFAQLPSFGSPLLFPLFVRCLPASFFLRPTMIQRKVFYRPSKPLAAARRAALGRVRGFTLMEMMIVVAIMGILTAVAYPSYRDNIVRGALVDGTNGLSSLRAQMERHYQDNRSYATVGSFTTPCANATAGALTFGNFVVSCASTPTANGFTVQAIGSGPAAGFTFTIDQQDVRATTAAATGYNTCSNKWLTKRGATC